MAYFEGITPTDIELYDVSGLGNKIPIWFRDLGLVFGVVPSLEGYASSDAVLKALDDRVALMAAAEKAYDNFKISHPECKCGFGEFRRACIYKSEWTKRSVAERNGTTAETRDAAAPVAHA